MSEQHATRYPSSQTPVQIAALATAGAIAAEILELGPSDLTTVDRCVTVPAIGLAILMAQSDSEWSVRWTAAVAAADWMAQAAVLRECLIWVLTPEAQLRAARA